MATFLFGNWTLCSIQEVYGRGKQPPFFCCLPFLPLQKCDSDGPISDGSSCIFCWPARDISAHLGPSRPISAEAEAENTDFWGLATSSGGRTLLKTLSSPSRIPPPKFHRDLHRAAAACPWQSIQPIFFLVWKKPTERKVEKCCIKMGSPELLYLVFCLNLWKSDATLKFNPKMFRFSVCNQFDTRKTVPSAQHLCGWVCLCLSEANFQLY